MFPNAIAANGDLVFGGCGDPFSSIPVAFVWTQAGGTQALQDILTANAITVPTGYSLANVLAASTDGSVLLGTALDANDAQKTFVLRLSPTAYSNP